MVKSARFTISAGLLALSAIALSSASTPADAATTAKAWAPLTTLSSTPLDQHEYQLDVLPRGEAIAVWGDESKLQTSTRTTSGTWTATVTVATVDGSFIPNFEGTAPALAVAPSGQVTVAWTDHWGSASAVIDVSTRAPGATAWSSPVAVSAVGGDAADPHLAVKADGSMALTWADDGGIEVASRAPGTASWTAPTLVSDVTKQSAYPVADTPRIAFAANGDLVATWLAPNDDTHWLRGSTWSAQTGLWSMPSWIFNDTALDTSLLTAAADGTVTAAWGGSQADLATWSDGTWGAPTQAFVNTDINSLVKDPAGGVLATGVDDARGIVVSSKSGSHAWTKPQPIGGGSNDPAGVSQAVSSTNGVSVVWNAYVNNRWQLQVATRGADGHSWSAPQRLAAAATDVERFTAAGGADGALTVLLDDQTHRPKSDGGWVLKGDSTVLPALHITRAPTVTGAPVVGHRLTAHTGTWSPAPTAYGYRWLRNGAAIPGATHPTYKPTIADAGRKVRVVITASRASYRATSATSRAVAVPHPHLRSITAPVITGKVHVGALLTASAGRWSPKPGHIAYQWLRNGHPIAHAHSSSYRVTPVDLGRHVRVRVTATRQGYVSASSTSPSVLAKN